MDPSVGEGRTVVAGVSGSGLCAWPLGSGVASGAEVGVAVPEYLGVADVSRLGGIRVAWPGVVVRVSIGDKSVVAHAKTNNRRGGGTRQRTEILTASFNIPDVKADPQD